MFCFFDLIEIVLEVMMLMNCNMLFVICCCFGGWMVSEEVYMVVFCEKIGSEVCV